MEENQGEGLKLSLFGMDIIGDSGVFAGAHPHQAIGLTRQAALAVHEREREAPCRRKRNGGKKSSNGTQPI